MTAPATTKNATGSLAKGLATAHISGESETVVTESTKATVGNVTETGKAGFGDENDYLLEKQGPCYVLPRCSLPPAHEMAPVEKFVANAVKEQVDLPVTDTSIPKPYRAVLSALRQKEDAAMLYKILLAFRTAGNGSTLHQLSGNPKKNATLLHGLFRFNPFRPPGPSGQQTPTKEMNEEDIAKKTEKFRPFYDYSIADAYLHLALALVSANSGNLVPVMTWVWKLVIDYQGYDAPLARTQRLHAALAEMTRLCPKGIEEIHCTIKMHFPFRTRPLGELIWCYRQAFAVVEYVPSIHSQLLSLVIDKCLDMDVEIKICEGGEVTIDDEDERNTDEGIFDLELDDTREQKKRSITGSITANEMAEKLDAVMLLTFQFLEKEGKHDVFALRNLYERCYPIFESSILIAHKSKFVQFIFFFLCGLENDALTMQNLDSKLSQQHATLYREFVAKLLEIVVDPYRPTNVRVCAACYLASFVSRAQFVGVDTVCECLCALLRWAETYIVSLPSNSISAADAREQSDLHALFYTICQASFYIMCFRGAEAVRFHREIEERELETKQPASTPDTTDMYDVELRQVDISPSRWARICGHALQPLKFCLETVRVEFLHVAEIFGLLDSEVLQRITSQRNDGNSGSRRKKASLIRTPATLEVARRKGGVGGLGRGSNPLDSFFPFDPYLLRQSHGFIEQFYRHWGDHLDDLEDENSLDMQQDGEDTQPADVSELDDSSTSDDEDDNFRGSYEESAMALSTPPANTGNFLTAPREAWTETLKRNRAPSIESGAGSW